MLCANARKHAENISHHYYDNVSDISVNQFTSKNTSSYRWLLAILKKCLSFDGAVHVIVNFVKVCW